MPNKFRIGITGGIGSGKSIVSDYIEACGYPVLRSDLIAKELMNNDEGLIKKISNRFGSDAYKNGKLDTKFLAENVFNTNENVLSINSIVHPPTLKKIDDLALELHKKYNFVFVESALVYEAKFEDMFDYVILVYTEKNLRIDRTVKRDKVDSSLVQQRMQFQISDEKKRDLADFTVDNNTSIDELKQRTQFVLNLLSSIAGLAK